MRVQDSVAATKLQIPPKVRIDNRKRQKGLHLHSRYIHGAFFIKGYNSYAKVVRDL